MTAVQDLLIRECITCTMWVRQIQCSILFTVQFSSLPGETNIMKDIWFVCLFVCFEKNTTCFTSYFKMFQQSYRFLKVEASERTSEVKALPPFLLLFLLISHPISTLFSLSHILSPFPTYLFPSKTLVWLVVPLGWKKAITSHKQHPSIGGFSKTMHNPFNSVSMAWSP